MAFVLAGGRGSRLKELTDDCAKPAIPFGGRSRIIDFALSNALNSGIPRIGVATQYKQRALIRHIERLSPFLSTRRNGSLDILPGSEGSGGIYYEGTAGAVFQNIDVIERRAPRHVVILAGDHVYKMDYGRMLRQHVATGADVTVGCITVPREEARGFGVMHVDVADRITAFVEKPHDPPAVPGNPDASLASMGIYVFDTAFLLDALHRDDADLGSSHDFGADIIPHIVQHGRAFAHRFADSCVRSAEEVNAYWRDVGTLDAYFAAHLDVMARRPRFDMEDERWPLWTQRLQTARAPQRRDMTSPLIVHDGVLAGSRVRRSLLSDGTNIADHANLEEVLLLPNCHIGSGARLKRVIVDAGVTVPAGLVVGEDPDFDAQRFRRTAGGVCLVTQQMIDRLSMRDDVRSAA
ncbi:glucose-1-phosphate adenylyltransferase [Sphingobium sp. H33]|uniref:Glucose-1-phosphate adenylyltransferase n=2 Tax=Sphingobium nicotianae TaxID=2782607 RepID=A0A9X1DAB3_9SPHN|nr:glucose-1-phosphate adenylyltransferase [Sphingobium nicotianae]